MAGNKDNMKQAMKELLGMVGIGPEGEAQAATEEAAIAEPEREAEADMGFMDNRQQRNEYREPVAEPRSMPRQEPPLSSGSNQQRPFATSRPISHGSTILASGTTIIGDVRCQGDVDCQGNLKGNLQTTGNVRITGKVLGDIRGATVELMGCAVQGNISAESEVRLDQDAVVVGDVVASIFTSDGKVKGNLQIEKSASFQQNSILVGDVTAGLLAMSEGAKIQGSIRVEMSSDSIPEFGETLDF